MQEPPIENFRNVPLPPPPKSAWPTAIGIIAIVFGAGGMLGGLSGLAGPLFNQVMAEFSDPSQAAVYEAQQKYQWWGVGLSGVGLLVAGLLLWGGIEVLKRRPAGAARIKQWAVAKIVLTLALGVFQAVMMPVIFEATQQQQGGMAMPEGFVLGMVIATVVVTIAWGAALPVFMLVWFGREKITAEVQSWGDELGRD
ncbi:MAG: hypothetical protein AAGA25_17425 [Planctomycetota bacterium]